MARKRRTVSETGLYHFINRGVSKKELFHCQRDYGHYLELVRHYGKKLGVQIYHYCLMSNHIHMLVQVTDLSQLSRFGYFLQRCYAHYYSKNYQWPEQVFRRNFFSNPVERDTYLLECGRYIERNPLKAGLVSDLSKYPFSSYKHYAYAKTDFLITTNPLYEDMGRDPEERRRMYRLYVTHDRDYERSLEKMRTI